MALRRPFGVVFVCLPLAALIGVAAAIAGCGDDPSEPDDGGLEGGGSLDANPDAADTSQEPEAGDAGAKDATADADVEASACGDGVVDTALGELCDTAIEAGAGACPTTCVDIVACTADVIVEAGTCAAACTHTPIIAPANGDGCCPPGANAANDNDCTPICGDGVLEPGEACDDGNTQSGDGCSAGCVVQ